jgi:1-deoxy-D-xylulose-5-phosphate reductoisomerase
MQRISVLGSTGSIGVSTLDVIRRHPDRYRVVALSAFRQVDKLFEQCLEFCPAYAVMGSAEAADRLRAKLRDHGQKTEVLCGEQSLVDIASLCECDTVMAAIVGAAGLPSSIAAAEAGKKVLLANKEALVMAGTLFMDTVARQGATLLPIDSEHNAVFQSLPRDFPIGLESTGVTRIILTASGGPFRRADSDSLGKVTPEQACAHPNWSMGRKISVDSATMMNKGLEVIEAHFLFGVPAERIEVLIHPQSIIHSMVEYIDGSVIAELGNPDMRTPIAHALAYPERVLSGVGPLDLVKHGRLDFEAPDARRFPCLGLAFAALKAGGTAPVVLNAANEIAVEAFLNRQIGFTSIASVVESALDRSACASAQTPRDIEEILAVDRQARVLADRAVSQLSR